jgi:hypothetical protein
MSVCDGQAYGHSLASASAWNAVVAACGDFSNEPPACTTALDALLRQPGNDINIYDVYGPCDSCDFDVATGQIVHDPYRNYRAPLHPKRRLSGLKYAACVDAW